MYLQSFNIICDINKESNHIPGEVGALACMFVCMYLCVYVCSVYVCMYEYTHVCHCISVKPGYTVKWLVIV